MCCINYLWQIPVVIDVLGPHATRPESERDQPMHNYTVLNPRDMLKTMTAPPGAPFRPITTTTTTTTALPSDDSSSNEDNDIDISDLEPSPLPPTETVSLLPSKPVILYILRETTAPGVRVMNLLPSLSALQNNEVCHVAAGNDDNLFGFRDKKGISSLHFLRAVDKRQVRNVEIFCRPVVNGNSMPLDADIQLDNFSLVLELHII